MTVTRSTRIRYGIALAVSIGAVAALVVGPLTSNIQYFRTVSEALEEREADEGRRLRMAGEVVPGSVVETDTGVEFEITDGAGITRVVHRGAAPQLFGEDVPVVAEGTWVSDHFSSDRILIRHDNQYRPPEVETTDAPGAAEEVP